MSEENVEIVREAMESFNRGDYDAALAHYTSDATWDWSNSRGFDARVLRGHSEIRDAWHRFADNFDEVRVELEDLVEIPGGLVVASNTGHHRGRDGIEVQAHSTWLIKAVDGKIASLTMYQTRKEALEAAGLSG